MAIVALFHPGAMGSRVGGELVAAGHEVRWLRAGRSDVTIARARTERLTAAADIGELLDGADVVLSLLPPQSAVEVAISVAGQGFSGTYVDANPVSPGTLATVRRTVEVGGATLVDAGMVGPPPGEGQRTSIYLAGDSSRAAQVEALFTGTRVTPVFAGTTIGQASAAKAAYALFNKGRMILASLAGDLADAHGVRHLLAAEADRPGAELLGELTELRDGLAEVGWRWGPEMDELARSLTDAGLDPALAEAFAAQLRRSVR